MAAKKQPSLVPNRNARKRSGTSRPVSKSTVTDAAYTELRKGWPKSHRARTSKGRRQRRKKH